MGAQGLPNLGFMKEESWHHFFSPLTLRSSEENWAVLLENVTSLSMTLVPSKTLRWCPVYAINSNYWVFFCE